jgi:hypothetical protein
MLAVQNGQFRAGRGKKLCYEGVFAKDATGTVWKMGSVEVE